MFVQQQRRILGIDDDEPLASRTTSSSAPTSPRAKTSGPLAPPAVASGVAVPPSAPAPASVSRPSRPKSSRGTSRAADRSDTLSLAASSDARSERSVRVRKSTDGVRRTRTGSRPSHASPEKELTSSRAPASRSSHRSTSTRSPKKRSVAHAAGVTTGSAADPTTPTTPARRATSTRPKTPSTATSPPRSKAHSSRSPHMPGASLPAEAPASGRRTRSRSEPCLLYTSPSPRD